MKSKLPITKDEDVEFSKEAADAEDMEAQTRAKKADHRQEITNNMKLDGGNANG